MQDQQVQDGGNLKSIVARKLPNFDPSSKFADPEGWCSIVDLWVEKQSPDAMDLIIALSSALKGEASSWLTSARPTNKSWKDLKIEFLALFSKPVNALQQFGEAVDGRQDPPEGTTLIDELLHGTRVALSLIKNRESDEALAVMFACHQASKKCHLARRRFEMDLPKSPKDLCIMLQGIGKRPALFHTGPHTSVKRPNLSFPSKATDHKNALFTGICHKCGLRGHRAKDCRRPSQTRDFGSSKHLTCFKCNKPGHIATNCPAGKAVVEKFVNCCTGEILSVGEMKLQNGKIIPFLFDTGSDCSLINETTSVYVNGKRSHNLFSLRGLGSGSCISSTQILAEVEIQNLYLELLFCVVPDEFISRPVIIGRDLITQNISVCLTTDGLSLSRKCVTQVCQVEKPINFNEISTDLNGCDRQQLVNLLQKFKYCLVTGTPVGRVLTGTLDIRLKDHTKIVQRRPYRLSPNEREIVRNKISELLKSNIIRPSCSPFASPIILVKKADGSDRICVDYRELNANTISDKYSLPLINDQINRLFGAFYFSSLDMASGFHQIPVEPESIERTAFVTPDGQYEYLTMPFGLKNAPSVYQRAIDKALGDLRNSFAIVYVDDILIPSSSISQGLERLEIVIKTLSDAGFSFNFKKCSFLKLEVEYLGYVVRAGELRPNPKKTTALINAPVPKTPTQVRQFLGLASYFRQFIPRFSLIAAPLYKLCATTSKTIKWQSVHEEVRQILLKHLTTIPVLTIFDPERPTELHTDASSEGYGAVLLQKDPNSKLHVVAYFSKRTSDPESRYHSYELETLAVVNAIKHFRHFLVGRKFVVITDCNAVKASRTKRELTPRVQRWWSFLQSFDFDLVYREGKRMHHADYLSRNPEEQKECNFSQKCVQIIDLQTNWLIASQQRDDEITSLITKFKSDELDPELIKTYDVRNKVLYRKVERNHRSHYLPIVPRSMLWSVINHVHTDLNHLGWEKTLDKLYELYWFPKMSRNVRKFVENCIVCKTTKTKSCAPQVQLHPIPKEPIPWHTIHVGISGKLSGKSAKNEYVFVIIDGFSKFVHLTRITSLSSYTAVSCLRDFTYLFGCPTRIICDQGRCFASSDFRCFCKENNIDLHFIAQGSSRANGQVERVMQTLKNLLSIVESSTDNKCQDSLGKIQLSLNSSKHRVSGFSPAELLFGVQIRSLELNKIKIIDTDTVLELPKIREIAQININKSAKESSLRFNRGKAQVVPYEVGSFVLNRICERWISKLDKKFRGPFKIIEVLDNDRYLVESMSNNKKYKLAHEELIPMPDGQGEIATDCQSDELDEPVSADETSIALPGNVDV